MIIKKKENENLMNNNDLSDRRTALLNKFVLPLIALVIFFILIIVFIIRGCSNNEKPDNFSNIDLSVPKIVYLGENPVITAKVSGKGDLKKTVFKFSLNNDNATLQQNELIGENVNNKLELMSSGRIILTVTGKLGNFEPKTVTKEIIICRIFSKDIFQNDVITLEENKTADLIFDLGSEQECYDNINYEILNDEIIEINDDGLIVGKKEGETKLVIRQNSKEVTFVVKVIGSEKIIPLEAIAFTRNDMTIEIGKEDQIELMFDPVDVTNKNVKWKSDNEKIVTVSNIGIVKGISKGKTTVTATSEDDKFIAKMEVTVKESTSSNPNTNVNPTPNPNPSPSPSPNPTPEKTPEIITATMMSNNSFNHLMYAKAGDIITVTIKASKALKVKPTVKVSGVLATVTGSGIDWTATVAAKDLNNGKVTLSISDYEDNSGNKGKTVTNVTSGNLILVDKTVPTCKVDKSNTGTTSGVTLKVSGSDSGSGINSIVGTNGVVAYNGTTVTQTSAKNGSYSGRVTDNAGNGTSCSATVTSSKEIDNYTKTVTNYSCPGGVGATIVIDSYSNSGRKCYYTKYCASGADQTGYESSYIKCASKLYESYCWRYASFGQVTTEYAWISGANCNTNYPNRASLPLFGCRSGYSKTGVTGQCYKYGTISNVYCHSSYSGIGQSSGLYCSTTNVTVDKKDPTTVSSCSSSSTASQSVSCTTNYKTIYN